MKTIFVISILIFFIGCSETTYNITPDNDPLRKAREDMKKQKEVENKGVGDLVKQVEDTGKMISDIENRHN